MRKLNKTLAVVALFLAISVRSFASVDLYFSPYDNIEDRWVEMIESAKNSIHISCFGLTNQRIYEALVRKRAEGLRVLVCMDKMQAAGKHSLDEELSDNDVEVVIKPRHVLEHNKMIVVDGRSAIVGSWNLSETAQKQDNSVAVMINEPILALEVEEAILRIYNRDK